MKVGPRCCAAPTKMDTNQQAHSFTFNCGPLSASDTAFLTSIIHLFIDPEREADRKLIRSGRASLYYGADAKNSPALVCEHNMPN